MKADPTYWTTRYAEGNTGWDLGGPSTPLREYIDQLEDRGLAILIPGAGNAYETEYLHERGFTNVTVLDISPAPLAALAARRPDFPAEHLIEGDFFTHAGSYDLVLEQTFFCSFPPDGENRRAYAARMAELIRPGGKLVGLWFDKPVGDSRPFGGSREEYVGYLEPYFAVRTLEPAYNSIKPRAGSELFGIFVRRGER